MSPSEPLIPIESISMPEPQRPTCDDYQAIERFRKRMRIDPKRIGKMRYAAYQMHQPWEVALAKLGDAEAAEAAKCFDLSPLQLVCEMPSAIDPSVKLVFETKDQHKLETVLLRSGPSRTAVCVSTQVGCQAGCPFCATARMGLRRNLTASEMIEQIHVAARYTRREGRRLRNIVFMGMGEPLHNEEELHQAIDFLQDLKTFQMPQRRITVSTVGIPDAMRRLIDRFPGIQVALSLHSAVPAKRARLVPWSRRYAWQEVQDALRYVANQPKTHRHQGPVMIEHIMIDGVNDSDEDADALIQYLDGMYVMVNLIPYNATDFVQQWQPTARARRGDFAMRLRNAGIFTTIRYSMGSDVQAACGQLIQKMESLQSLPANP
ncbi:MAG: 23S rRNA (adenine(2503)-C(2))-methyltransferase RlmN [Pirellulaceae bacterium]